MKEATVICWPVHLHRGVALKGSSVEICQKCGAPVWVSPVSKAACQNYVCIFCVPDDATFVGLMPGQAEEIREALKEQSERR
ncbi:MAG TPA: hypothetical protein PKA27_06925 [Fimbriimonadaceae bacterium]|nr:hypothetical protein [Fimbriimonadaceae bacterium]